MCCYGKRKGIQAEVSGSAPHRLNFLCLSVQYKLCYAVSRIYLGYGKEACLILRNTLSNEFKSSKF